MLEHFNLFSVCLHMCGWMTSAHGIKRTVLSVDPCFLACLSDGLWLVATDVDQNN